jgi:hypothetical protein
MKMRTIFILCQTLSSVLLSAQKYTYFGVNYRGYNPVFELPTVQVFEAGVGLVKNTLYQD